MHTISHTPPKSGATMPGMGYQPPRVTSTLGQRLRAAREASGLSQAALAKLVGCSRTYLTSLETGHFKGELGSHLALAIADALSITVRWLVIGDATNTWVNLVPPEDDAIRALRCLPDPIRQQQIRALIDLAAQLNPEKAKKSHAPGFLKFGKDQVKV